MNMISFPKIELHRHLEGSLRLDTLLDLGRKHGVSLPADTPEGLAAHAQVLRPMGSLQEVLDAFDLFQQAFRTLEATERLAFEAVEDAALEGIRLLELRFSPGFMAEPAGLDWDAMMEAVLRGVARELRNTPRMSGVDTRVTPVPARVPFGRRVHGGSQYRPHTR